MASSSPMPRTCKYDVFPSFFGPDVRNPFLSHLRSHFSKNYIYMFHDESMDLHKILTSTFTQEIRESRISIVVLSKNYASSSWCLNELLEILKCKEDTGQIVMPLFYGVDPSDVRKQKGEFGMAFKRACAGKKEEEKERWSRALKDFSNIAGEISENWDDELKMIEKITRDVSNILNSRPSTDFDGMVGLETHLWEIESLLDLDYDGVKMVGICGPSGIGKTTIARALLSLISSSFQLSCFMGNLKNSYINSGLDEYGLKLCLQEQLLSSILNQNGVRIHHLGAIKERLYDQRVLIILDGVDDLMQLDALAGDTNWFGPGSRIIVTTKNKDILWRHGINNTYNVDFPLEKNLEALETEVQALNAMRNDLLKRVLKEEGRGLQVLPEVKEWVSMVKEIEAKAIPLLDQSISECHKLSKYDDFSQISVLTRHYNELVCMRLKEVETLKSKGVFKLVVDRASLLHVKKMQPLQPTFSIEKLLDKITLETSYPSPEEAWDLFQEIVGETTLNSHPDIPQLARIVARKCGGFSFALYLIGVTMSSKRTPREWYHAIHVLVSSAAEFTDTKYEILPILKLSYDSLPGENIRLCFLYCALFPEDGYISKQDLVDCLIGEGIIADEDDREIAEMKCYEMIDTLVRMRLLIANISADEVCMHGVVREMALWIASDFGRRKENFVMTCGNKIQEMPEVSDWAMVRRMSVAFTQIENISNSPNCSKLTTLFLQGNNNLKRISGDFFRWMTSLAVLNLSSNIELSELPEEVSSLVSLHFLNLSHTRIKKLPLGLKKLEMLMHLDLDYTCDLQEINVIASLLNLQVLRLFKSVPMDLSILEVLQVLENLEELNLTVRRSTEWEELLSIQWLVSCIRRLHLSEITTFNRGILSLSDMVGLRELEVSRCDVREITVDERSNIQKVTVRSVNIEKFTQFQNIRSVTLYCCRGLRDLTWLLIAPNLVSLHLNECPNIEQIISKEKARAQLYDTSEQPFQNLRELFLLDLPELESIYWAPLPFPVPEKLHIRACPKLKSLPFDSALKEIKLKGVEWEDEATNFRFSDLDNREYDW